METIHLKNFKCFRDKKVKINNLTVLAGTNSVGKSSVIQGILVLHSALHNKGVVELNNSKGVKLGYDTSLLNVHADDSDILIEYESELEAKKVCQTFRVEESKMKMQAMSLVDLDDIPSSLANEELYYLCAERIGPRLDNQDGVLPYRSVGTQGEYTAQVLEEENGRIKVLPERWHDNTSDPGLKAQTNAWLTDIIPDLEVGKVQRLGLQTQIFVNSKNFEAEFFTTNVGFGFSYVLPIIVTGLIAKPKSFMIVENPEVHLHPAAQVAFAHFLFHIAKSGVKVVVETHSDHILEGFQIDVATNPEWASNVSILSFESNTDQPTIQEITFDNRANFSDWPNGFMDQTSKNYQELNKIRNEIK